MKAPKISFFVLAPLILIAPHQVGGSLSLKDCTITPHKAVLILSQSLCADAGIGGLGSIPSSYDEDNCPPIITTKIIAPKLEGIPPGFHFDNNQVGYLAMNGSLNGEKSVEASVPNVPCVTAVASVSAHDKISVHANACHAGEALDDPDSPYSIETEHLHIAELYTKTTSNCAGLLPGEIINCSCAAVGYYHSKEHSHIEFSVSAGTMGTKVQLRALLDLGSQLNFSSGKYSLYDSNLVLIDQGFLPTSEGNYSFSKTLTLTSNGVYRLIVDSESEELVSSAASCNETEDQAASHTKFTVKLSPAP